MSRLTLPSITSGFYVSEATGLVNRRLSNMYTIIPQGESSTGSGLVHTPGIVSVGENGEGASRGVLVFNDGTEYRVIGSSLWKIAEDGTGTELGSITGSKDVSIATNGINIAIQDPTGSSYFYTPSTDTFEINTNAAFLSFGQAETVTFKDGFYVYTTKDIFFSSSAKTTNDGKDFNALDFEDAEIAPDKIIKGWNNHNQLYIMGETTIELYQTVTTSGFPFQRITNGVVQKGCIAPNSVTDFDDGFLFMGGDVGELPGIWKGVGSSFSKISTSSVDQLIHQYSESIIKDSRCWTYAQNGAYFAVFTIGNDTLVYDATASKLAGSPQWHARQSGLGGGQSFFPWRARHGVLAYGAIRVGDDRSGKIGKIDKNTYMEYGNPIERLIPTIPYTDKLSPIFAQEIELFMRTGVGNEDVEDPEIRMNYSDDGGDTFFPERWRKLGKKGQRNLRVRWSRLGRISKSRMFQFKITDPVPVEIYALYGNAE
jgi:hypothetical protein